MANRLVLSDDEWYFIFPILATHQHIYVGSEQALRGFMSAVLWGLRNGGQWRTLPAEYGKWNSIFKRFFPLVPESVWANLHRACIDQPDL
ncbi:MAG: transposase [Methylobacter sp.]|uniref:transposase n=1 Tax=Methylobacter sp. TaxID=2051955 RepID=UPI002585E9B7|nr:transposase [Methylobacter sp.]MCL7423137.1 transposase [Methylobacter sp.]